MVSPFAPHLGEECWDLLGNNKGDGVAFAPWVQWKEELCVSDSVTLGVQVRWAVFLDAADVVVIVVTVIAILDVVAARLQGTWSLAFLVCLNELPSFDTLPFLLVLSGCLFCLVCPLPFLSEGEREGARGARAEQDGHQRRRSSPGGGPPAGD